MKVTPFGRRTVKPPLSFDDIIRAFVDRRSSVKIGEEEEEKGVFKASEKIN